MSVVVDAKTTSLVKMGYGELALKEETDGMAEINLWDLIVVKLSELGILKRYYSIPGTGIPGYRTVYPHNTKS